jgi:hypothetical protein
MNISPRRGQGSRDAAFFTICGTPPNMHLSDRRQDWILFLLHIGPLVVLYGNHNSPLTDMLKELQSKHVVAAAATTRKQFFLKEDEEWFAVGIEMHSSFVMWAPVLEDNIPAE